MKRSDFLRLCGLTLGGSLLWPSLLGAGEMVAALSDEESHDETEILEGESLEGIKFEETDSPSGNASNNGWKGMVFHGERQKKQVALTLDDGPSRYTPEYLDILKNFGVPCTFFLIGRSIRGSDPGFYRRYQEEGHELANHSWSHSNLSHYSFGQIKSEICRTQDRVEKMMGLRPVLFRPPYGRLNASSIDSVHQTEEMKAIVMWDVDPADWKRPGWRTITNRVLKGTKNGSIILSHDNHGDMRESLPILIDYLQLQGYRFVTVSELLAGRKGPAA